MKDFLLDLSVIFLICFSVVFSTMRIVFREDLLKLYKAYKHKGEMIRKTKELLDLFSDRKRWTDAFLARNIEGRYCSPVSEEACMWCLLGGIAKIEDVEENKDGNAYYKDIGKTPLAVFVSELLSDKLVILEPPSPEGKLWRFNDKSGYEQIKTFLTHSHQRALSMEI